MEPPAPVSGGLSKKEKDFSKCHCKPQAAPAGDAAQHGVVKYHPVKGVRLIGRSPGDDQQDLAGVSYADAGLADQGARFLDDIPFFALFKHRQIKSPIILRGRRASARYSFSLLYRSPFDLHHG